jgi:tetratricopeptide (TPR) repeat protein
MMPGSDQAAELERSGLAAFRRGDLATAYDDFLAARAAYDASGSALKAAEMANNLCVVLVQLGRGREAVWVVQGTAETFTEGGDLLSAARAFGNLASALEAAGDLEEAATAYQRALEGLRSLGDQAGESQTWQALSRLQLRRGAPLAAATSAQAALDTNPSPGRVRGFLRRILAWAFRLPRP